jgi:hypothetical protein
MPPEEEARAHELYMILLNGGYEDLRRLWADLHPGIPQQRRSLSLVEGIVAAEFSPSRRAAKGGRKAA